MRLTESAARAARDRAEPAARGAKASVDSLAEAIKLTLQREREARAAEVGELKQQIETLSADEVQRNALAAIADRFATVTPNVDSLPD